MKIKVKEIFNIPNILCYIRLLLIPLFVITYIKASEPRDYYIAALIILISGITDFADGFIARKYNMITELGKAIDPIADKLTQVAIVFSLVVRIRSMFILLIIFAVKETLQGIVCLLLLRKGKKLDGAMWFGKVSTAVFYATMFTIIIFPKANMIFINILIGIATIFLSISFALYIPVFYKMFKESKIK